MEQFLKEVRDYAAQCGVKPGTIVQKAGLAGNSFTKWASGKSSPTHRTIDRVRAYIAANPAPKAEDAA